MPAPRRLRDATAPFSVPPAATSSRLPPVSKPSCAGLSSTAVASASPARTASVIWGPRVGRISGSLTWARAASGAATTVASRAARKMPTPGNDAARIGRGVTRGRDAAKMVMVPAEYSHEPPMQNWDRPPPGISVAELFERWLPDAFVATGQRAPAGAPTVRATISGAGGGTWDVRADATALSVGPPGKEPPDIWIRQSVGDLRVALGAPDADLPVLVPSDWSARD